MLRRLPPFTVTTAVPRTALAAATSASQLRFSAASATATEELADISPMTVLEREEAATALREKRTDRFLHDMYRTPVASPVVVFLCTIAVGGFLITWMYNVATPVYLAHLGRASDDEDGDNGDELD